MKYDLIVVGSGPGGYLAAERAACGGLKVLLIEKGDMGGVCTNSGCIPTKSLLNSVKYLTIPAKAAGFGTEIGDAVFSLTKAMEWKQTVMETLRGGIGQLMKHHGVEVVIGEAEFPGGKRVVVGEAEFEADNLIIATGSKPVIPPIPGTELPHVLTSAQVLQIDMLPESIAIIGGGVIGIEFAKFFQTAGTQVHVVEMLDEILPLMDRDVSKQVRRELKGIGFNLGCRVTRITADKVFFENSKGVEESLDASMVLMSVGRKADTSQLEAMGLEIDGKGVVVDERMQTSVPGVYAVGDVNGRSLLAHSAYRMAEVAVSKILGETDIMSYDAIPSVVYSTPEVASCGLTEEAALEAGYEIRKAKVLMRSNGRFLAENGKGGGFCKIVVDLESDRLLGVHMVGSHCSEMIFGVSIALEARMTVGQLKKCVFPHPTVSEVFRDALWMLN